MGLNQATWTPRPAAVVESGDWRGRTDGVQQQPDPRGLVDQPVAQSGADRSGVHRMVFQVDVMRGGGDACPRWPSEAGIAGFQRGHGDGRRGRALADPLQQQRELSLQTGVREVGRDGLVGA